MKKINLILILFLGVVITMSCTKKEGCNDPKALNFDSSVEKENNSECRYTTTTFYASSNTFAGAEVTEILLTTTSGQDTIGIITSFNQSIPSDCSTAGTVQYTFQSGGSKVWFATHKLATGGVVTSQGDFSSSPDEECLKIDVLP